MDGGYYGARETFFRIALMLFALAGLADSAAIAPRARRQHALAILQRGQSAALGLLADIPDCEGAPTPCPSSQGELATGDLSDSHSPSRNWGAAIPVPSDDSPEDARLLAARLRMLAFMIAHMAMLPGEPDGFPGQNASSDRLPRLPARENRIFAASPAEGMQARLLDAG